MAMICSWIGWIAGWIAAAFTIPPTKAAAEEQRDKVFDKAKRLSDFIGMIVRLAFLFYAISFFGSQAAANLDTLKGFAFGVCLAISFGFSIVFGAISVQLSIWTSSARCVGENEPLDTHSVPHQRGGLHRRALVRNCPAGLGAAEADCEGLIQTAGFASDPTPRGGFRDRQRLVSGRRDV